MTTQLSEPTWEARRDEWLVWVGRLLDEISGWAGGQGWSVDKGQKEIREDALGTYSAPTLRIRLPGAELHVEPVALEIVGAHGRIDLEAWPSLNRVKLVRVHNDLRVITDSGVPLREAWNQKSFSQLAKDLISPP